MKGELAILESCKIIQEGEKAEAKCYTVCLLKGQPVKLVTPEGREGPVAQISYPLPEDARRDLPFRAAHILMYKPKVLGFVAIDEDGRVKGVIPTEKLRSLIVTAMEPEDEQAREKVAAELNIDEKRADEVIRGFVDLSSEDIIDVPTATIYICNAKEGCDTMFIPQQAGVPIPDCAIHECPLVEKKLGG